MRKLGDFCIDDDRNIEIKNNIFLFVYGDLNVNIILFFEIKLKCV